MLTTLLLHKITWNISERNEDICYLLFEVLQIRVMKASDQLCAEADRDHPPSFPINRYIQLPTDSARLAPFTVRPE
jgi:hypothetical protein